MNMLLQHVAVGGGVCHPGQQQYLVLQQQHTVDAAGKLIQYSAYAIPRLHSAPAESAMQLL
jgi:hypothetical protein